MSLHELAERATLMSLPMEVHLRIKRELLRDPDTGFEDFKALRLVCRTFDAVWSPVVLFRLSISRQQDCLFQHLRHLIQGPGLLPHFRALTLRNWGHAHSRRFAFIRRYAPLIFISSFLSISGLLILILYLSGIKKIALLLVILLVIIPSAYILLLVIISLKAIINDFTSSVRRFLARRYAAQLPQKIRLPNVHSVQLYIGAYDDQEVIYRSTRMVLSLPLLAELELYFSQAAHMLYTSRCLLGICNLNKLVLSVSPLLSRSHHSSQLIGCFGELISHNPNLSHLALSSKSEGPYDLSKLLQRIPPERPLNLEHVSVGNNCTNLQALLPHIQSLQSFGFYFWSRSSANSNGWCLIFSKSNVFPPTINVELLDWELITYLNRHPGVINLTIQDARRNAALCEALSKVLARHSENLRYLALQSWTLAMMLCAVQNETNLLRCTNLEEIVLIIQAKPSTETDTYEQRIFPVIARLSCSLTVVIRCADIVRYKSYVEHHCSNSENPLVHKLVGRIVHEKFKTSWN